MSQYANLKATIAANVYQNHNNEVTANMVKAAMNAMTDSLGAGYQYLGIATPATNPGTPDQRVFYIAAQAGTYTNFSGLVVNDGELAVLKWDTAWHKETIFLEGYNSIVGKRWYYEPGNFGLVTSANYIATTMIKWDGKSGDSLYWKYTPSGTPANNLFLVILNENKEPVANWLANNAAGERTITASSDYSYIVCSGVVPTDTFLPTLKINGNLVWQPKLGWEYNISTDISTIQAQLTQLGVIRARTALIYPNGGSYFQYNRATAVMTFPASTTIRFGNAANEYYNLTASTNVTLSNNSGVIVFNKTSHTLIQKTTQALGADDYIVCSYNKVVGRTSGELICSLPQGSVRYSQDIEVYERLPQAQRDVNIPNIAGARYAFTDNVKLPLQLLWFTDLHKDEVALKDILYFKSTWVNTYIDDIIATGDQLQQYFTDDFAWWATDGASNVLQVIGNHEVWKGGESYATAAEAYQKFFAPFISNWGVVSAGTDLCYYYKDYTTNGVRLIVLDCMNWDTAQKNWLISTLADARTNNLAVVIAQHYMAGTPTPISCNFTALNVNSPTAMISAEAPQAVADFITAGGTFVCWIGGHYHADYIYELANFPGQYGILLGTASRFQTEKNNFRGSVPHYDLFSTIQIDLTFHRVKLIRCGCAVDRWMRHKQFVCFDYTTGDVIVY